jgi:hypothetical protein
MIGSSIAFRNITPRRRVARRDGVTISIVSHVTTKRPERSLSLTRSFMGFPIFNSTRNRLSRYDWFHVGPRTLLNRSRAHTKTIPRRAILVIGKVLPNNPTVKSTLFPSKGARNVLSLCQWQASGLSNPIAADGPRVILNRMNKQTKPIAASLRFDSTPSYQRAKVSGQKQPAGSNSRSENSLSMRIARGDVVIGKWSATEVKERLENGDLTLTDLFYDEEGDWQPLSELPAEQTLVKTERAVMRPCYCGTGLPFRVCCGDGRGS